MSFSKGYLRVLEANRNKEEPSKYYKGLELEVDIPDKDPEELSVEELMSQVKAPEHPETAEDRLIKKLGFRESTNNYKAVNSAGYLGKYQQGAMMLIDLGIVKRGTNNKGLDDPQNWNHGLSKEKYLSDKDLQERLIREEIKLNKRYLGNAARDDKDLYGLLSAAHLLGAFGAKKRKGKDGNGTTFHEYYQLGISAY